MLCFHSSNDTAQSVKRGRRWRPSGSLSAERTIRLGGRGLGAAILQLVPPKSTQHIHLTDLQASAPRIAGLCGDWQKLAGSAGYEFEPAVSPRANYARPSNEAVRPPGRAIALRDEPRSLCPTAEPFAQLCGANMFDLTVVKEHFSQICTFAVVVWPGGRQTSELQYLKLLGNALLFRSCAFRV